MRSIFVLAITMISLAGCAGMESSPPAWTYYDQCAQQSELFLAMAACGKQHRNAACEANNSCSSGGNAIVMYADSLVIAVRNHEMTESEAARKWLEYRMTQVYAYDQNHRY